MIIFEYLIQFVCIFIAIILHEMSHAYMSHFLGDPTPKETGRLSPNPLKHIDPIGFFCMLLFGVGWAKPVMINSEYYKNRKLGMFLVALAGPLMNFILAIVGTLVLTLILKFNVGFLTNDICIYAFQTFIVLNIGLGVFNLIPIPPLDGSRLVGSMLTANAYNGYMRIQRYGFIIIVAVLSLDRLAAGITGNPTLFSTMINFIYDLLITGAFKVFGLI